MRCEVAGFTRVVSRSKCLTQIVPSGYAHTPSRQHVRKLHAARWRMEAGRHAGMVRARRRVCIYQAAGNRHPRPVITLIPAEELWAESARHRDARRYLHVAGFSRPAKARWLRPAHEIPQCAAAQFSNSRGPNVRTHFINQFGLGGSSPLTLNVNNPARGTIQINRITVRPELPGANAGGPFPWTGTYFNNVPISLTVLPKPGYRFVGWTGVTSPTATASITLNGSAAVTAIFIPELRTNSHWNSPSRPMPTTRSKAPST